MSIRRLYCEKCAKKYPPYLDADEKAMGWKFRIAHLKVKKPLQHFILFGDTRVDLDSLHCDQCNAKIPDGSPAVALTQWRTAEDPPFWEKEFSTDFFLK